MGKTTVSDFTLEPGQRVPFVLTWFPSHEQPPEGVDAEHALADTEAFWLGWANACPCRPETTRRSAANSALGVPPWERGWGCPADSLDVGWGRQSDAAAATTASPIPQVQGSIRPFYPDEIRSR
jgi:hypothetical protein